MSRVRSVTPAARPSARTGRPTAVLHLTPPPPATSRASSVRPVVGRPRFPGLGHHHHADGDPRRRDAHLHLRRLRDAAHRQRKSLDRLFRHGGQDDGLRRQQSLQGHHRDDGGRAFARQEGRFLYRRRLVLRGRSQHHLPDRGEGRRSRRGRRDRQLQPRVRQGDGHDQGRPAPLQRATSAAGCVLRCGCFERGRGRRQANGGLDALFAPDPLADRAGSEETSRWTVEGAWGFPAFANRFTGSPHAGVGFATGSRDYTIGWRLTPAATPSAGAGQAAAPDLSFELKAVRGESDTAAPEHRVEVRARW